ncbi:MAG: alkaline phosphatase family protein [Patescibacteria group bacterium]|nr:alkaline phosphatase family protein [Patescibacteria group bacterium]
MKKPKQKVFVFGVDGMVPELVFGRYKKDVPNIARLMQEGMYARMRTTIPPTSIVAWTSINSGRDPSETGVHSYTEAPGPASMNTLITSENIRVPMLWDMLDKKKKTVVALNIPLTYPVRPIHGAMISDFLTPSFDEHSVHPRTLKSKITKLLRGKEYLFDVAGFTGYKKLDLDMLIKKTYTMSAQHFRVAQYCMKHYDWDLFNMVIIGTDRLHHMFWRHMDPHHPRHLKNSPYKNVIRDYYQYTDRELGKLLASSKIDKHTTIIVVSDHGMDRMECRINLNDWLRREKLLILKNTSPPLEIPRRLRHEEIDWKKTCAIASGGYQGRIYLFGKEKVKLKSYLIKKLNAIKGERGEKLQNRVFDTKTIYRKKDGKAPDIIVYFDNLRYGVNNDIGNFGLYSQETTVGIDDAGHSPEGVFVMKSPLLQEKGKIETVDALRIAPTILKALGMQHKNLPGKPLL